MVDNKKSAKIIDWALKTRGGLLTESAAIASMLGADLGDVQQLIRQQFDGFTPINNIYMLTRNEAMSIMLAWDMVHSRYDSIIIAELLEELDRSHDLNANNSQTQLTIDFTTSVKQERAVAAIDRLIGIADDGDTPELDKCILMPILLTAVYSSLFTKGNHVNLFKCNSYLTSEQLMSLGEAYEVLYETIDMGIIEGYSYDKILYEAELAISKHGAEIEKTEIGDDIVTSDLSRKRFAEMNGSSVRQFID